MTEQTSIAKLFNSVFDNIQQVNAASAQKDLTIQQLTLTSAQKDVNIQQLTAASAQKDLTIQQLTAENARKDVELRRLLALEHQLTSVRTVVNMPLQLDGAIEVRNGMLTNMLNIVRQLIGMPVPVGVPN